MGSAARYPTANVEAMKTIAWDRSTQEALTEQWQYVKAIPEVPGGYFTSRYFDFAFRDVVLDGKDVRETMVSPPGRLTMKSGISGRNSSCPCPDDQHA